MKKFKENDKVFFYNGYDWEVGKVVATRIFSVLILYHEKYLSGILYEKYKKKLKWNVFLFKK